MFQSIKNYFNPIFAVSTDDITTNADAKISNDKQMFQGFKLESKHPYAPEYNKVKINHCVHDRGTIITKPIGTIFNDNFSQADDIAWTGAAFAQKHAKLLSSLGLTSDSMTTIQSAIMQSATNAVAEHAKYIVFTNKKALLDHDKFGQTTDIIGVLENDNGSNLNKILEYQIDTLN
jgi:hypothetical protein